MIVNLLSPSSGVSPESHVQVGTFSPLVSPVSPQSKRLNNQHSHISKSPSPKVRIYTYDTMIRFAIRLIPMLESCQLFHIGFKTRMTKLCGFFVVSERFLRRSPTLPYGLHFKFQVMFGILRQGTF